MKISKKILLVSSFIVVFSLFSCNLVNNGIKLPASKPSDFNFVLNYGIQAKNQLDTTNGKFTKDMVTDPSVITDLRLSDEEMNEIYLDMKMINILQYSDIFSEDINSKPHVTYSIKISYDGKEKDIYWEDAGTPDTKEAKRLRELFKKIANIVEGKDEYKSLPPAKGGYD